MNEIICGRVVWSNAENSGTAAERVAYACNLVSQTSFLNRNLKAQWFKMRD